MREYRWRFRRKEIPFTRVFVFCTGAKARIWFRPKRHNSPVFVKGMNSRMKKLLISITALVLILTLFAGCSAFMKGFREGLEQTRGKDTEGVQTVKSDRSSLSMEFPNSWKEASLHDVATIQMAFAAKEQYMIVIEESASDFDDGFTIDDYAAIILENMKTTVEVTGDSTITDTTIGGNLAAKQFELAGSIEKVKAKYLVTCIENDGIFYQFTAWSLQSKYDEAKPAFEDVLKSIAF